MSWVLWIGLAAVVLWLISAYNGLVSLRNQTVNAFKQIDVQLKRRHDLIPNLVNAVRGAMDFEKQTLEAVIQARNQAVQVTATGPEAMKQIGRAENTLTAALSRLLVVMEQYPHFRKPVEAYREVPSTRATQGALLGPMAQVNEAINHAAEEMVLNGKDPIEALNQAAAAATAAIQEYEKRVKR